MYLFIKSQRRNNRFTTFVLALLFATCSGSIFAQPTVHLFTVFCNAYPGEAGEINSSVSADRFKVKPLFSDFLSEEGWGVNFRSMEIQGENATKAVIQQQFEAFTQEIGKDDTIYIHFSGHGVILDAAKGEQFLETCDMEKISRKKWAEAIDDLPCRLKIFITDCCSIYPPSGVVAEGDERVDPWNNFYYLLMRHEGFVNITAASPGQAAFGTRVGGYLTVNLESDIQRYRTWKEVFIHTQKRVFLETKEELDNAGIDDLEPQKPFAYSLGLSKVELDPGESLPASLQYIMPGSNQRLLSQTDIGEKNLQQLYLARNEIYARHGFDFKTKILQDYFKNRDWYSKREGFKSPKLSNIEKRNVDLILKVEIDYGGPFVSIPKMPGEAGQGQKAAPDIFPYSSNAAIPRTVAQSLTLQELSIARNEIFARHGYPFSSRALQEYFGKKTYYKRNPNATDPDLKKIEEHNMWLLKKIERIKGGAYKW